MSISPIIRPLNLAVTGLCAALSCVAIGERMHPPGPNTIWKKINLVALAALAFCSSFAFITGCAADLGFHLFSFDFSEISRLATRVLLLGFQ